MSVNALIDQSHLPEVEALLSLLQQFVARWRSAPTFEQRLLVEAQAVSVFEELLNLSLNLQDVQAGQHPELFEFQETYDVYGHLLRINMAKLRSLAELFLQHFNSQQLQLLELMGKLKRIKQKQASLNLWSDDKAKFVLADHFLNLDWIGTAFTSATAAEVDSTQGLLTLPVRNRVQVAVTKTRVGSGSNGQPGNSDEVVTTNNTNPDFAVNGDPNNWFEYERLDAGPLELVYVLELGKGEIVNHLQITPLNLGGSYGFEVENITFTTSGGGTKRLDELVSGAFDDDFYTVKSLGADTSWNISFLPVVAKAISIKFVQRNPTRLRLLLRIIVRSSVTVGPWPLRKSGLSDLSMSSPEVSTVLSVSTPLVCTRLYPLPTCGLVGLSCSTPVWRLVWTAGRHGRRVPTWMTALAALSFWMVRPARSCGG